MNGLIFTALMLSDPAVARSQAELLDHVAVITRMAEPYLRVQPTDTPEILAMRHRLARLIQYTEQWVAVSQRQFMKVPEWFNLAQVGRNMLEEVCSLSTTPAETLACQMTLLSLSQKLVVYEISIHRWVGVDPSPWPRTRVLFVLYRQQVQRAARRYFLPVVLVRT